MHPSTEERLQPETVLPEQFFAGARDTRNPSVHRLMLYLLQDAIQVVQGAYRRRNPRGPASEAQAWIDADDDDYLFSFRNVCETLGLDPDAIRAGITGQKVRRLHHRTDAAHPRRITERAA